MVSSKCLSVGSPSPLRFLAALMPPWAQTEWERLTGTMEKRSTLPPASAILMTAERPASPPPTTMILGVAAMFVPILKTWLLLFADSEVAMYFDLPQALQQPLTKEAIGDRNAELAVSRA